MNFRTVLVGVCIAQLLACSEAPEQPVLSRTCGLEVNIGHAGASAVVNLAIQRPGRAVQREAMTPNEDGHHVGRFDVEPGQVMYWVEIDGRKTLDPKNPLTMLYRGQEVSVSFVESCQPGRFVYVGREGTSQAPRFTLMLERGNGSAPLDGDSVKATAGLQPLPLTVLGDHVIIETEGLATGKYTLTLEALDTSGRKVQPFEHPFWVETKPFRWEDATIYQILVDRFAGQEDLDPTGADFTPGERHGGHLRGITRHLKDGYFEALGANVLWLSPLYKNPTGLWTGVEGGPPRYSSYHGYWPIEPRQLDERVGTAEDLDELVQEAHKRGMRVLVDVVPNHIHQEHIYRIEHPKWSASKACVCGSPDCPWWRDIATCWFTPYLPDVEWNAPGALTRSIDDMMWWLKRFNLDGLRIDAVMMIPRFVTRHLTHRVATELEGLRTRHYLVGETFTGPDGYDDIRAPLGADGIDGQFDFPLMWALRNAFAWKSSALWVLADQWKISQAAWRGSAAVMANMVGNHDVTRFISEATPSGANRYNAWLDPAPAVDDSEAHGGLRLALAFVLTMPGVATLYYGDEIGIAGGRDPDNRRPMRFQENWTATEDETARYARRLGTLRRCMSPFERRPVEFLRTEAERLAYMRISESEGAMIVVLSRSPTTQVMDLKLNGDVVSPSGRMVDVLTGHIYDTHGGHIRDISTRHNQVVALIDAEHPCAQIGDAQR